MGTFGHTNMEATILTISDRVGGSVFTTPEAGVAKSITVGIRLATGTGTYKVKCALYLHSDLSLKGVTDERSLNLTTTPTLFTFTFATPPSFLGNTDYVLVAWAEGPANTVYTVVTSTAETDQLHLDAETYNSFPNPLVPIHLTYVNTIYCTYAVPTAHSVTITDQLGMLEVITKSAGYKQTITDKLGMLDTIPIPKGAFKQAITDIIGMLDTVTKKKIIPVTITDILGMRDRLVTKKSRFPLPDLPDHTIRGGAPP